MKKISGGSAKTKLFDKIKSFFVRKKYTWFNKKILKKGVIDKEEYIYNKKHIQFNKNNEDEIKSLFEPLLENNKSMKHFLFEVTRFENWINKKCEGEIKKYVKLIKWNLDAVEEYLHPTYIESSYYAKVDAYLERNELREKVLRLFQRDENLIWKAYRLYKLYEKEINEKKKNK